MLKIGIVNSENVELEILKLRVSPIEGEMVYGHKTKKFYKVIRVVHYGKGFLRRVLRRGYDIILVCEETN
jgi:hypothetical protein